MYTLSLMNILTIVDEVMLEYWGKAIIFLKERQDVM